MSSGTCSFPEDIWIDIVCESAHEQHGIGAAIHRHVVKHYQYDTSDVRGPNRVVGA